MHLRRGFAERCQAGDGVIPRVAGPREIVLLSICGVELGSMDVLLYFYSLLGCRRDNIIGIFGKSPLAVPLIGRMIILRTNFMGIG
jgi:hypothetical protein